MSQCPKCGRELKPGAKFCGGDMRLYSLFLDPERMNMGFTLFIDGFETGETLKFFKGFCAEASGRLHGKVRLFLKNGRELKLGKSYIYSVPGETGSVKVYDKSDLMQNLALGGVSESSRENIAKALSNLDYTALKIQLRQEDDESMSLSFKIEGSSTCAGTSVPVTFEITFHGDIEQLLNISLKSRMLKKQ